MMIKTILRVSWFLSFILSFILSLVVLGIWIYCGINDYPHPTIWTMVLPSYVLFNMFILRLLKED